MEAESLPVGLADEVPDRIGSYEVDRVIGRGAHGVVFKATDPHGIKVAIKWLKKRRDETELDTYVQLSKTLNGMPPILSSGVLEDRTYFVMPYYERRSLRFRLRSLAFPQPVPAVIRMASAIADVLGELHRHGYTHGDFKPDNVLLEALPSWSTHSDHSLLRHDERLVLTDFGTARSAADDGQFGEGTPGYAAPEILSKLLDHDPRVDVYAAAATVVECMTGVAPTQVRQSTDSAFDDAVFRQTGSLESVLRQSLSFDPERRPPTVSVWFDALTSAARAPTSSAPHGQLSYIVSDVDVDVDAVTTSLPVPVTPGSAARPADASLVAPGVTEGATSGIRWPISRARSATRPSRIGRVAMSFVSFGLTAVAVTAGYWAVTRLAERPVLLPQDEGESALTQINSVVVSETAPEQRAPLDAGRGRLVPGLLETTPDPEWGTPRTRLTAVVDDSSGLDPPDRARFHRVDSSNRSVASADGRWILAERDGTWTAVNTTTAEYRALPISRQRVPTWHPTEPATILHTGEDDLTLLATTVDGSTEVVADLSTRILTQLPAASSLSAAGRGSPSGDGWRYAWAIHDVEGAPVGFAAYDLASDTMLGLKVGLPDAAPGAFDSIAMAKSGESMVLAFDEAAIVYSVDFGVEERRIEQRPNNYELALSGLSEDVMVVANSEGDTFGAGWIVVHNLESGSSTRLLDLSDSPETKLTFSGLATARPGWVLASSHGCEVEETWSCDRVMAINVDDGAVIDLAQTDSCAETAFAVPTAVVNADFTRAWFNTDFGSCGDDATIVELAIDRVDQPGSQPVRMPPSGETGQPEESQPVQPPSEEVGDPEMPPPEEEPEEPDDPAESPRPVVDGNVISWADDGWYQVQRADTFESLCEGGRSCEVSDGVFIVINLTTGQRWEDVVVGGGGDPVSSPRPVVDGNVISWADDGWYQVQRADTFESLCEGGRSCEVSDGVFIVINLTTGQRWEDVVVNTGEEQPGP